MIMFEESLQCCASMITTEAYQIKRAAKIFAETSQVHACVHGNMNTLHLLYKSQVSEGSFLSVLLPRLNIALTH